MGDEGSPPDLEPDARRADRDMPGMSGTICAGENRARPLLASLPDAVLASAQAEKKARREKRAANRKARLDRAAEHLRRLGRWPEKPSP